MKKDYQHPEMECISFSLEDILTTSGLGEGDGLIDDLDDAENPDPWS